MRRKAVVWAVAGVALTAGYPAVAGWNPGLPAMVAAGVLVGCWLVVLHYLPVLFGWVGELLDPVFVCVASGVSRVFVALGAWMFSVGLRLGFWARFVHRVDVSGGGHE